MNWKDCNKKFYFEPDNIVKQENECFKNIITNIDIVKKKCLDIGCGSGYWIHELLNRKACIMGVDLSLEGLKECYAQYSPACNFVLARGEILPFPDSSFNVIIINWVLQELYKHDTFVKLISEICRTLKTNGKCIIAENIYPDKRVLCETTNIGDIFKNQGDLPLLRFFPNNTLLEIMDKVEFKRVIYKRAGYSFFEVYKYKP